MKKERLYLWTRILRRVLVLWVLALTVLGCVDDIDNEFATHRAFFRYQYVSTTLPLYSSLSSPGEWCTISFPSGVYRFQSASGSSYDYRPTALDIYTRPECIAGFIVGTKNMPDFNGNFETVAYDLVCAACYDDAVIQRSLTLCEGGKVQCKRCGRTYDLNLGGYVVSGAPGSKLFRYRLRYVVEQNTVLIQN